MPLVVFCGPDGAGKSTQASLLRSCLQSSGIRNKKSWIRARHTVALAASSLLVRAGYSRRVANPYGRSYLLPDLKRLPALRRVWPYLEVFSLVPVMFYRTILPSRLGWVVVSERMTIDTVPALVWLLEEPSFFGSRLARVLIDFTLKTSCIIHLDATYDVILARRREEAEPEEFIRIQRESYAKLSEKIAMLKVDTSQHSVRETQATIRDYVRRTLDLPLMPSP